MLPTRGKACKYRKNNPYLQRVSDYFLDFQLVCLVIVFRMPLSVLLLKPCRIRWKKKKSKKCKIFIEIVWTFKNHSYLCNPKSSGCGVMVAALL